MLEPDYVNTQFLTPAETGSHKESNKSEGSQSDPAKPRILAGLTASPRFWQSLPKSFGLSALLQFSPKKLKKQNKAPDKYYSHPKDSKTKGKCGTKE